MKNLILSILLPTLLVFPSFPSGYAFPDSVKEVKFWAPEVMLEGYEYDVMITLVGFSTAETRFDLISNNENIVSVVDRKITIDPFKSHGIAKVRAKSVGKVELFAISGEELLKTSVQVVEPALRPAKLDLILPSDRVSVKQIPAYVFLFDAFDNPVRATQDIEVNISPFGNVKTQINRVVIKQGMHYSKFILNIEGDGGISVAANNLESDTETLNFGRTVDDIELKVKIAPDILATGSSGELYVWLEKDGKLFIPDKDVKVVLSSEDSRHLAFSKAIQHTAPFDRDLVATTEIFIRAGTSFSHTMVWTTDFLLTQNQNFTSPGSNANASKTITVTAVSEGVSPAATDVEIRKPVEGKPDRVKVFALPDPAYDKLDIIVALYSSGEDDEETRCQPGFTFNPRTGECEEGEFEPTCPEGTGFNPQTGLCETEEEESETAFRPVVISESIIAHISTDNLLRADFENIRIGADDLDKRDHYTVIPARTLGKLGPTKITSTVGGAGSGSIEIQIEQLYSPIPTIVVKPLPALTNTEQDMFMVYAIKDGVMADSEIKNLIINTKPVVPFGNTFDVNALKVVTGKTPDLVPGKEIEVTAIAPGYMGTGTKVSVSNPELRHIVAYHPSTVHVSEPFPVVFYAADEKKNPIELVEPSVSPTDNLVRMEEGLYMLSSGSEPNFVFYAEGVNPGTSKISAFSYDIEINASVNKNQFSIGDDIILTYNVIPADAKVTLDTDLPFEKGNNRFILEATIPGSHTLTVTAEKDGFESTSKEVKIDINLSPVTIGAGEESSSEFDLWNISPNNLTSNPTILMGLVGIIIAIVGVAFYMIKKRKNKQTADILPEEDLTFSLRGDSSNWPSIS